MKKNIYLLLIALGAIVFTNCSKDEAIPKKGKPIKATSRDENFALSTNKVTFEHEMLIFEDKSTFDDVVDALNLLDQDEEFKTNFIESKGESASDPESSNYVQHAAFQAFEERFTGYVSMRRKLQTDVFNGVDDSDLDQTEQSPLLQTLLSFKKRIKIGDIYFQEIDKFHTLVSADPSFDVLNAITDPQGADLPPEVFIYDNRIVEDVEAFGGVFGEECTALVLTKMLDTHKFQASCFPTNAQGKYIGNSNLTYSWVVKDNAGATIYTATGYTFTHQFPSNTQYPLSFVVTVNGGDCSTFTGKKVIESGTSNCVFNTQIIESTPGNYEFYLSGSYPNCTISWDFTLNGQTTTVSSSNYITGHRVSFNPGTNCNSSSTCNFTVKVYGNCCSNSKTFTLDRSCGVHANDKFQSFNYQSGERRAESTLWMDNRIYYKSFGSKQLNYRFKSNGRKVAENADYLEFQFRIDDQFLKDCNFIDLPNDPLVNQNQNEKRIEYTWRTGKVSARHGEVECTYLLIENSTSHPNHTVISF